MTILWSLIAAMCAVGAEYLYRTLPGPWIAYLYIWVPIQLLIGFAIYKLITAPGVPMVGALVIWTFAVMGLRIFVSAVVLRDSIPVGTWVALVLMIAARVSQQVWR